MKNILTFLLIISITSLDIDFYATEPYVELDWTKINIGKIEITFIDDITKNTFDEIYLYNSTYKIKLQNCAYGIKKVRCLITSNDITGDPDNKDYKFYYKLQYLVSLTKEIEKAYVTIAVNNGSFIKFNLVFLIFLIIF